MSYQAAYDDPSDGFWQCDRCFAQFDSENELCKVKIESITTKSGVEPFIKTIDLCEHCESVFRHYFKKYVDQFMDHD